MRNSQNPFQSSLQDLNNWRTKPISEGMSEIERKKTDFHKEIRKQQLEDIFRAKRKILLEDLAKLSINGSQSEKRTLISCYKAIASNEKVHENVCALVNLLALQKPFEGYSSTQSNPSASMIEKYCTDLINLLLKKVIPSFSNEPKSRISCFNAIANLFADPMCENVRYVKIVVQTLNEKYGDIDTWGCNQEMVEIYYMIANLQRKTIIHTDLLSVEKLLGWGETGIHKLPSDPLKALVQGFTKLFTDVDNMFNSRHQRSFFTDHFRASREIIIENMIKRLISAGQGNKLNSNGELSLDPSCIGTMLKFMGKNKIYVLKILAQWQEDMEDRKKIKQFCDRLLSLINQPTLKTVSLREMGGFLTNLLVYYPQQMQPMQISNIVNNNNHHSHSNASNPFSQQIDYLNSGVTIVSRQFLTSQTMTQIMISICHQSFECKVIYLKIIHQLMYNIQRSLQLNCLKQVHQVFQFIMVDKRLEDILSDFLSEMHSKLKNVDLLRMILDIYHLVIRVTEGKLCHKLKQHIHSLLQSPPQFIPTDIFEIMDELYVMHEEKAHSTLI